MASTLEIEAPLAALALASSRGTVTYERFLGEEFDGQRVEWIDGVVVPMSPVSYQHQKISLLLQVLLELFVERHGLGQIAFDPFQMKTGPGLPGRAPDILFVATEHLGRLKATYLEGPADLVIEIVSPGSRGVDRGDKFREYEQGGVGEFWLVDPERRVLEISVLDEKGTYRTTEWREGVCTSKVVPGFWIRVEWLWRDPLPTKLEVLRDLKLI